MISTTYELVYEKNGSFFGSETGIPTENDVDLGIRREDVEGYALVYAADGKILGSVTGIPSEADTVIYPVTAAEENTVTHEEPTVDPTVEPTVEPTNTTEPTGEDIPDATEGDQE